MIFVAHDNDEGWGWRKIRVDDNYKENVDNGGDEFHISVLVFGDDNCISNCLFFSTVGGMYACVTHRAHSIPRISEPNLRK